MGHQGRTHHSISELSLESSKSLSSTRSSDGRLKPSSDNLVPSPIGEHGKGTEQGIIWIAEESREIKNAWWDPWNDSSKPRDDTMTAEQDNEILTWVQYLIGRMEGSWDQSWD